MHDSIVIAKKYKIKQEIASGAFGTVYLALHKDLDRLVAIKALHAHYSQEPNFRSRFLREAKALAKLNHENIVGIYDILEEEGIYYIVMEYIDGISLDNYLAKKVHLSLDESLAIAIQVAKGLEHAHQFNIIHRDIKPQNILLNKNNQAIITDFGIVAAAGEANLTLVGQVVGTPRYMSPEQACGEDVDARSDIYSLGIVLYQMLTGKNPFEGMSSSQVMRELFSNTNDLELLFQESVPDSVQNLIFSMLENKREERIENCSKVLASLIKIFNSLDNDNTKIAISDVPRQVDNDSTVISTPTWSTDQESINNTQTSTPQIKTPRTASIFSLDIATNLNNRITLIVLVIVALVTSVFVILNYGKEEIKISESDSVSSSAEQKRNTSQLANQKKEAEALKIQFSTAKNQYNEKIKTLEEYSGELAIIEDYQFALEGYKSANLTAKEAEAEFLNAKYETAIEKYGLAISEMDKALDKLSISKVKLNEYFKNTFNGLVEKSENSQKLMIKAKEIAVLNKAQTLATSHWVNAEKSQKIAEFEESNAKAIFQSGGLKKGLDLLATSNEAYIKAESYYKEAADVSLQKFREERERKKQEERIAKEKTVSEKIRQQDQIKKPVKTDYEIISTRLKEFEKAYESRNLSSLKKHVILSPKKENFVKSLFSKYEAIEISITSLELRTNTALATITIEHLIDARQEATIPGSTWKTFQMNAKKLDGSWGRFEWK